MMMVLAFGNLILGMICVLFKLKLQKSCGIT